MNRCRHVRSLSLLPLSLVVSSGLSLGLARSLSELLLWPLSIALSLVLEVILLLCCWYQWKKYFAVLFLFFFFLIWLISYLASWLGLQIYIWLVSIKIVYYTMAWLHSEWMEYLPASFRPFTLTSLFFSSRSSSPFHLSSSAQLYFRLRSCLRFLHWQDTWPWQTDDAVEQCKWDCIIIPGRALSAENARPKVIRARPATIVNIPETKTAPMRTTNLCLSKMKPESDDYSWINSNVSEVHPRW